LEVNNDDAENRHGATTSKATPVVQNLHVQKKNFLATKMLIPAQLRAWGAQLLSYTRH
jgi:hypothetical protein